MPPFRLRTKSIAVGTPAAASTPASCPAPDASSTTGTPSRSSCSRSARVGSDAIATSAVRESSAGTTASTSSTRSPSGARTSTLSVTRAGITFDAPGSTSSRPTVATAPFTTAAASRSLSTNSAAATRASERPAIGVVPACPSRPSKTTSPRAVAAMPVTTASGTSASSSRGPCSTCSSTKAAGAGSSPPAHSDREPTQPGPFQPSSSRKATTVSVRSCCPARSIASSPPITPSAPSKRPPAGTESRCEPVQTSGSSGRRPRKRP